MFPALSSSGPNYLSVMFQPRLCKWTKPKMGPVWGSTLCAAKCFRPFHSFGNSTIILLQVYYTLNRWRDISCINMYLPQANSVRAPILVPPNHHNVVQIWLLRSFANLQRATLWNLKQLCIVHMGFLIGVFSGLGRQSVALDMIMNSAWTPRLDCTWSLLNSDVLSVTTPIYLWLSLKMKQFSVASRGLRLSVQIVEAWTNEAVP